MSHTPGPWDWVIHDHSMASLGVLPDPGLGDPLVMAIGPCPACADRADPKEWRWDRCHTPSEANARLIAASPDLYALAKAYEAWEADLLLTDESWTDGELPRLTQAQYDRMIELQDMRNAVLAKVGEPS